MIYGLDSLKNLKYLNLASNKIKTVEHLEGLQSLEKLILSHNQIINIIGLSKERFQYNNPKLLYLDLNDNLISNIEQLHYLSSNKKLNTLILGSDDIFLFSNPVCKSSELENTIKSYLPMLEYYNGMPIKSVNWKLEAIQEPKNIDPIPTLNQNIQINKPAIIETLPLDFTMSSKLNAALLNHLSRRNPTKVSNQVISVIKTEEKLHAMEDRLDKWKKNTELNIPEVKIDKENFISNNFESNESNKNPDIKIPSLFTCNSTKPNTILGVSEKRSIGTDCYFNTSFKSTNTDFNIDSLERELFSLKSKNIELISKITELESESKNYQNDMESSLKSKYFDQISNLENRFELIQSENNQLKLQIAQFQVASLSRVDNLLPCETCKVVNLEMIKSKNEFSDLLNDFKTLSTSYTSTKDELNELKSDYSRAMSLLSELQSKHDNSKKLNIDYENQIDSLKKALERELNVEQKYGLRISELNERINFYRDNEINFKQLLDKERIIFERDIKQLEGALLERNYEIKNLASQTSEFTLQLESSRNKKIELVEALGEAQSLVEEKDRITDKLKLALDELNNKLLPLQNSIKVKDLQLNDQSQTITQLRTAQNQLQSEYKLEVSKNKQLQEKFDKQLSDLNSSYGQLKENYDTLESTFLQQEINFDSITNQLNTANNRCQIIDQIEAELEQLRVKKCESDQLIDDLNNKMASLVKTLEDKENHIKDIEIRNLGLIANCSNLNISVNNLNAEIVEIKQTARYKVNEVEDEMRTILKEMEKQKFAALQLAKLFS